jgi:hypothetical protein
LILASSYLNENKQKYSSTPNISNANEVIKNGIDIVRFALRCSDFSYLFATLRQNLSYCHLAGQRKMMFSKLKTNVVPISKQSYYPIYNKSTNKNQTITLENWVRSNPWVDGNGGSELNFSTKPKSNTWG